MKIYLKYKLLLIIAPTLFLTVIAGALITFIITNNYHSTFFDAKTDSKMQNYETKRQIIQNSFDDLSAELEVMYKKNIENDFKQFLSAFEHALIIESLQEQTEAIAALTKKYSSENYALVSYAEKIYISNDIQLWNQSLANFFIEKKIELPENHNQNECFNLNHYFGIRAGLKNKAKVYELYFFVSKKEFTELLETKKNTIIEIIESDKENDKTELISDKKSFVVFTGRLIKISIIVNLIIICAGLIFIVLLLNFIFIKLRRLRESITEIQNKNYSYRLNFGSKLPDEFDEFGAQLNTMAEQIESEKINELISVTNKLLPARNMQIKNYHFSAYINQSKEIGGDFFDFIKINDERYLCVIADVVGKSFPGAFLFVLALSAIRLLSRQYHSAAELIFNLNKFMRDNTPSGKWFTMILADIDLKNHSLEIINCGHPPAYFIHNNNLIEIEAQLPMVGQMNDDKFKKYILNYNNAKNIFTFEKKDILFMFTDGLLESYQSAGLQLNSVFKQFIDSIDHQEILSAEKFAEILNKDLKNIKIKDDLTFMIIQRTF